VVAPKDDTISKIFTFYVKLAAKGGFETYMGPYYLSMGCPEVTVMDNDEFVEEYVAKVGQTGQDSTYPFKPPIVISAIN
jgi:hypothetical protein